MTERLAVMQSPTSEEDQVMTLLGSLPSSYDSLVAMLGARMDHMELSMVERDILDEKARRVGFGHADPPGVVAMYGKSVASARGKKSRSKTKGKCFLCKRLGHFQHDCPKKKAEGGSAEQHTHVSTTVDKDVAFVATPAKVGEKKSRVWIIDSGASRNMSWDRGHLEDYHTLDTPELIRLGDNHMVEGWRYRECANSCCTRGWQCAEHRAV